jgi:hypothetical protein
MNSTLLYVAAVGVGLLMFALPFLIFLGIGTLMHIENTDPRLFTTYVLAALVLSFASGMGVFALIQNQNCGKVEMRQVASNAALAFAIQTAAIGLTWFFPSLQSILTNLLPTDLDPALPTSIAYGFYSFWAAMYGITIGGSFSAVCPGA